MTTNTPSPAPNHHAHHPGFSGASGALAALSMAVGRGAVARLAADLVALSPGDDLVDVGCGPGTAARVAAARGASVTGVDPAPVMLDLARRLTRRSRPVTWRQGAAEALPVADRSASVVWSLASVHHWTDVEAGLAEAARVLRPGGRLLAVERRAVEGATGHASHGWIDDQAAAFATLAAQAGFSGPDVAAHRAGRATVLCVFATRH